MQVLAISRKRAAAFFAAMALLAVGAYMTLAAFVQQVRGKTLAKGESCEDTPNAAAAQNQNKDLFVSCSGFLE